MLTRQYTAAKLKYSTMRKPPYAAAFWANFLLAAASSAAASSLLTAAPFGPAAAAEFAKAGQRMSALPQQHRISCGLVRAFAKKSSQPVPRRVCLAQRPHPYMPQDHGTHITGPRGINRNERISGRSEPELTDNVPNLHAVALRNMSTQTCIQQQQATSAVKIAATTAKSMWPINQQDTGKLKLQFAFCPDVRQLHCSPCISLLRLASFHIRR
jgi:hypothetical protein